MSTLNKYWQKREDEGGILEEIMCNMSGVFSGGGSFDDQFEQFEAIYSENVSTFV